MLNVSRKKLTTILKIASGYPTEDLWKNSPMLSDCLAKIQTYLGPLDYHETRYSYYVDNYTKLESVEAAATTTLDIVMNNPFFSYRLAELETPTFAVGDLVAHTDFSNLEHALVIGLPKIKWGMKTLFVPLLFKGRMIDGDKDKLVLINR